MKLLCITEPTTHPSFDTTVALYSYFAEHAEIQLFHALSTSVSEQAHIPAVEVKRALSYQEFLALEQASTNDTSWDFFDLVFCRTDKPRPAKFHEHLLMQEDAVAFVNHPAGVETAGSWSFTRKVVAEHLPEHVFTRDRKTVADFVETHGAIVAKQSGSYGGREVSKIEPSTSGGCSCDNITRGIQHYATLDQLLDEMFSRDPNDFQFVRFLKNIGAGDKRVLVVDGEIYGAYVRKSSSDTWVHNISAGGGAEIADVGEREIGVIKQTVPEYRTLGIHTLGYDFLMDDDGTWVLSEINAGNIGGYNRLEELGVSGVLERLTSWLLEFSRNQK